MPVAEPPPPLACTALKRRTTEDVLYTGTPSLSVVRKVVTVAIEISNISKRTWNIVMPVLLVRVLGILMIIGWIGL